MSRITIRDIAKLIGVNPSTVSRALKDHPDISVDMKAKIRQVAEELGYYPNYQAVNFRNKQSKLIALVLPEIGHFFMPDMLSGIEEIARKRGYTIVMFQTDDTLEREKECLSVCQSFGIDGLLVSLSKETTSTEHFEVFAKNNIPVVFVDKVIKDEVSAMVSINDFTTAYTAVQHLAKRNYQKIAGIFGSETLTSSKQRKAGYYAALEKYNLPSIPSFCVHANSVKEAKEDLFALLNSANRPDAIFSMTDDILSAVIEVTYALQLRVPDDIAIITISNGYLPHYCNPKITHIKHSGHSIGVAAANLLVDLIQVPSQVPNRQLELETFLVELDSC